MVLSEKKISFLIVRQLLKKYSNKIWELLSDKQLAPWSKK